MVDLTVQIISTGETSPECLGASRKSPSERVPDEGYSRGTLESYQWQTLGKAEDPTILRITLDAPPLL